ncbi:hypothetical protein DFH06DRAFT_1316855 [Mycena polygramma]|nr:hypothetical protein DFH06DRAFT_1316855 [Mycena polygramma]
MSRRPTNANPNLVFLLPAARSQDLEISPAAFTSKRQRRLGAFNTSFPNLSHTFLAL